MIRSQEPPGWRRGTCTRTPVFRPSGLRSAPGPRTGRWAAGSRQRTSPRHRPSAGRWPGSPPARSPAGQPGRPALPAARKGPPFPPRRQRRAAERPAVSPPQAASPSLHRSSHNLLWRGPCRYPSSPPGLDRPVPGPGLAAATPHDNWYTECTRRSTHLPLPEAGTDSPSCADRRRFDTDCRSAPVTVRDPTSGPASDRINESVLPAVVKAEIGTQRISTLSWPCLPRATRSVRGLPYRAAAGWALVMAGT